MIATDGKLLAMDGSYTSTQEAASPVDGDFLESFR